MRTQIEWTVIDFVRLRIKWAENWVANFGTTHAPVPIAGDANVSAPTSL